MILVRTSRHHALQDGTHLLVEVTVTVTGSVCEVGEMVELTVTVVVLVLPGAPVMIGSGLAD